MNNYKPIVLVTLVIAAFFLLLDKNHSEYFEKVEGDYKNGLAVNLSGNVRKDSVAGMLLERGYINNAAEADFIADALVAGVYEGKELDNLYSLRKNVWKVSASAVDSLENSSLQQRCLSSRSALWQGDNEVDSLLRVSDLNLPSQTDLESGEFAIDVRVTRKDSSAGYFSRLLKRDKKAVGGTLVCLRSHYITTVAADTVHDLPSYRRVEDDIIAFAMTDENGEASFKGLNGDLSYSVLPVACGYEFGSPKGTIAGSMREKSKNGKLVCEFTRQEHKVTLFSSNTLNRIKEDSSLTVRSPQEFRAVIVKFLAFFFAAWWGLVVYVRIRRRFFDGGLISVLMLLTGFCLLNMFSINNPLNDKMLGVDMASGIIAGVVVMALLYGVDFVRFYQDRLPVGFDIPLSLMQWFFMPFRRKISYMTERLRKPGFFSKCIALMVVLLCTPLLLLDMLFVTRLYTPLDNLCRKLPKGSGYLILGLILTALLFTPLGQAVGGMKVNLNIGIVFQPSEITKYLIIFFMAAFFCQNADSIVKYSEEGNISLLWPKLKLLLSIVVGLGVLMALYMALGDMGPALVIAFTFIILYSIIKSKTQLTNDSQFNYKDVLTSDIAMLVYGVLSFALFLFVGNYLGNMGIFCLLWFVVWLLFGFIKKKQIYETPILFNIIIAAFIFGGQILSGIDALESAGQRLESRKAMCTNTWGELGLDGEEQAAGENTQVAQGLWALATGGMFGQGLGGGDPHEVPAFHTDMILESIGEQMGFIGLFVVVVALAFLLRRVIVFGYRTNHPFAFFLCSGISIVTAVQFLVISLGSTGIIPLTGVTVPFFSYGKVSMILNLSAIGVILAISNTVYKKQKQSAASSVAVLNSKNISRYNYSVSILSAVYSLLIVFVLGVFLNYQLFNRDNTLVRRLFVKNVDGNPVVEYNPRIFKIAEKMEAGNIYDRNGLLLATSNYGELTDFFQENGELMNDLGLSLMKDDHKYRYYPFKEHLYFMLGDMNSKLFFSVSDHYGVGYVAEAAHLSLLRGYENTEKKNDIPVKVTLRTTHRPNRYISFADTVFSRNLVVRDYSALIPYLKAGTNSSAIEEFNRENRAIGTPEKQDIQLTIDAALQVELQNEMPGYVEQIFPTGKDNLVRMSAVILDAENGDLLTSAVYPLPDYDILEQESNSAASQGVPFVYNDQNRPEGWRAFSDIDLGLRFPSHPGSTAKIMSAMAGYMSEGREAISSQMYRVLYEQTTAKTERTGKMYETADSVNINRAFVWSSNCYFINLVNDKGLYDELKTIYGAVGVSVNGERPYVLSYKECSTEWGNLVLGESSDAMAKYGRYVALYSNNEEKTRYESQFRSSVRKNLWRMNNRLAHDIWNWAWGQGGLDATPLAMARVASIVANDGDMPVTRYLLSDEKDYIHIYDSFDNDSLRSLMKQESRYHSGFNESYVGGKTGTAERVLRTEEVLKDDGSVYVKVLEKPNDAWYVCFVEDVNVRRVQNGIETMEPTKLAIAVRIERAGNLYSSAAKNFVKDRILPILRESGYIVE